MKKIGILNIILILLGGWIVFNGFNVNSKNQKLVEEASNVKDVKTDKVLKENDGKIIAISGEMKIEHNLTDETLGISIPGLKLKRVTEMYQWEEDCDDSCTYKKVWSENPIDSSEFSEGHSNPEVMPYESKEYVYSGKIGEFEIPTDLISKLSYDKTMSLEELQGKYNYYGNLNIDGSYLRNYTEEPKIGDFRISYKYTTNDTLSIIGVQSKNTIKKFKSSSKRELYEIRKGKYNGKEMLEKYTKASGNGRIFACIIGGVLIIIGISPLIPKKENQ